ncbi:hypothetical protein H310_02636 [Aphanomyces invadans]|uniref:Uncharacterized protein n=1 Tax=Aphanomyces invadans TaxID=157072 RepID=A0A024UIU9_9STRA|nr:hypothetical protein H310_02636 [Aphanomyces invadans]ETW06356.1 hypothetical protein H310_02636 [Aphanomyces invadans]|eukprot:XP_008864431.1 hypothetical protein H310_02636 [Aphanomyces invadans]
MTHWITFLDYTHYNGALAPAMQAVFRNVCETKAHECTTPDFAPKFFPLSISTTITTADERLTTRSILACKPLMGYGRSQPRSRSRYWWHETPASLASFAAGGDVDVSSLLTCRTLFWRGFHAATSRWSAWRGRSRP